MRCKLRFWNAAARSAASAPPGMILASCHLLNKKPEPTLDDIREGLAGNLCRCTGYMQIFDAVAVAARRRNPA